MREIVLDTETTGLDPAEGHRIVEIGGVELLNHIPTGRSFHRYINPEREVPLEAFNVHGLSTAFLSTYPTFAEIADDLEEFLGDAVLVMHNAGFDTKFLNAELKTAGRAPIVPERVIDTLALARRKHPAAPSNSLDALCRRYGIDNSRRGKHGALVDSELLQEVYIELIGGRQTSLTLDEVRVVVETTTVVATAVPARPRPVPLPSRLSEAERAAHAALVERLGPDSLWRRLGS